MRTNSPSEPESSDTTDASLREQVLAPIANKLAPLRQLEKPLTGIDQLTCGASQS